MGYYYDGVCYKDKTSAVSASISGKFYVKQDGTPDFLFLRGEKVCTSIGCVEPSVASCSFVDNERLVYDFSYFIISLLFVLVFVSSFVSISRKL